MPKAIVQRKEYSMEQIMDYMDCSLCYHLKYIKKLEPPKDILTDNKSIIYKECVTEAMRYYYLEHQLGKPPTLKAVYDKFYSLWLDKTNTRQQNSIMTRSEKDSGKHEREKNSRYVTMGYETLKKFYGQNANKKQAILAVNHPYQIVLDDMTLVGHFDLIREVLTKDKRREIEVVSFQLSNRKPEEDTIKRDISLTAMEYAFRQMFQTPPDSFLLNYVNRQEEIRIFRDVEDYKRLFSILKGFIASVDTVPPFPRPGAHRIYSPYKEYCDHYRF